MGNGTFVRKDHFPPVDLSGRRFFDFSTTKLVDHYNREAFSFSHNLCNEPLLQFDNLCELCKRLPSDNIKFRRGQIPKDANFDLSCGRFNEGLTLQSVIQNFDQYGSYIAIYFPETDPEYKQLIEGLIAEIYHNVFTLDSPITWYATYIFMSTNQSVTPYHMDREMNFLLQIQGKKHAQLWRGYDDRVMTSSERDTLLTDWTRSRPTYKPALDKLSKDFELRPGIGLHHPFIAPHLISTTSERSISLAITYRTELSDYWTDAHNYNYYMRKLGLTPWPVGANNRTDKTKAMLMRAARNTVRPFKRLAKSFPHSGRLFYEKSR